jgi:hypothetical protein
MMPKNTNEKRKTKIDKNMLGAKLGKSQQHFFFLALLGKVFTEKHFLLEKEPVLSKK